MKNFVLKFALQDSDANMISKMWEDNAFLAEICDALQCNMVCCKMKIEPISDDDNNVTSFFFYMWNAWCEDEAKIVFAESCGGYKHYWNKWVHFCNEYGVRAAVDMLYVELDEGNRNKLVARALEKFDGMSERKK